MKKYVLAFLAFVGLNLAGLFCIGFAFGIIAALGGETDPQAVQESAWIDFLVILGWPIISFFAFKFSIERIILKTKDEDSKLF